MNILILDDERDAANMLSELLALLLAGCIVRVAYAGDEAIAAAMEQRPDAAVLDLEMIGMDGEAVARSLRAAYPDRQLLLVALSGNVLRLGGLRATGIFDHLLSKPVDVVALVEVLKGHARSA